MERPWWVVADDPQPEAMAGPILGAGEEDSAPSDRPFFFACAALQIPFGLVVNRIGRKRLTAAPCRQPLVRKDLWTDAGPESGSYEPDGKELRACLENSRPAGGFPSPTRSGPRPAGICGRNP
jgi:hypothetical protein